MRKLALVTAVLAALFGCEDEDPCDRYAEYICVCHADDPTFDCDELIRIAEGPSPAVSEGCAIDLADQRAEDDNTGLECPI